MNFEQARTCVLEQTAPRARPAIESVPLAHAAGRVLATDIRADRDYPPMARSVRDGFAVRSADLPGRLRVVGEVRAGEVYGGQVDAGEAVEIMTGAPLPRGADAVVMVEYVERDGAEISTARAPKPGEFINPQGAECRQGDIVLNAGTRLEYNSVAMLATTGHEAVDVFARPRVAILATGDELVESGPVLPHQVRNSNAHSLAVQTARAGGIPQILPVARDTYESTRELAERGLTFDLLLLSGGVSAGKYDVVERVLADLGAEFFFDRVLIQPGQPLVFGRARGTFFFGLPGNPASTMVTFRIFAQSAIERLGGEAIPDLPLSLARLARPFRHKPGLTRFLPATLKRAQVTPVAWQGSSDVAALAKANAFLVARPEREQWEAGDVMEVLPL